jgi:hypothetical protein
MKKTLIIIISVAAVIVVGFVSLVLYNVLKKPEEKTFTSEFGMTVVLDESFIEDDTVNAQWMLKSNKTIFAGSRDTKEFLESMNYNLASLDEYIELILQLNKETADVAYEGEGADRFGYAYYSATISGADYSYMLICKESETAFSSMNFACKAKDFEENKAQYMEWAKKITVE